MNRRHGRLRAARRTGRRRSAGTASACGSPARCGNGHAPRVLCRRTRPAANAGYRREPLPIEKAFAIHATPERIYAALDDELREAEAASDGEFEILKREPGSSFDLRVNIGGVPCWLTYRIEPKGE